MTAASDTGMIHRLRGQAVSVASLWMAATLPPLQWRLAPLPGRLIFLGFGVPGVALPLHPRLPAYLPPGGLEKQDA